MSTKSENWYVKNVVEDHEDIETIANLAKKALYDKLSIEINSTDVVISTYGVIFKVIEDYIKEQQESHPEYSLNIANRFEIGYTNTDDESQEKVGNFMIYMKVLENNAMDMQIDEDEDRTIELATQWNAANITSNVEAVKEISARSLRRASQDLEIELGSLEVVIPFFCIVLEQIIAYMKIKRAEENVQEYEINLCGLCHAGAQCFDGMTEVAYFRPTVTKKRVFKDDKGANKEDDN